jgi:hypothetical protein
MLLAMRWYHNRLEVCRKLSPGSGLWEFQGPSYLQHLQSRYDQYHERRPVAFVQLQELDQLKLKARKPTSLAELDCVDPFVVH